jgi:hypothetical protein
LEFEFLLQPALDQTDNPKDLEADLDDGKFSKSLVYPSCHMKVQLLILQYWGEMLLPPPKKGAETNKDYMFGYVVGIIDIGKGYKCLWEVDFGVDVEV